MLQNIIPPRARVILYSIYGYIGILGGAVVVAFTSVNENPRWLIIGTGVYLFLGKPLSQLAGDNVSFDNVLPTVTNPVVQAVTPPAALPPAQPVTVASTITANVPAGYTLTESGLVPIPTTSSSPTTNA